MTRRSMTLVCVCLSVLCFLQDWGKIVDDTKLDLLMAPPTYIRDALHLWTPLRYFGTVESQTWGFLFPMGPFFALGKAAHIPVWITERTWTSLLLIIGFCGLVRLAEAFGLGRRWTRVAAGIAYVVSPIMITWAGTSSNLLTVTLLPWSVLFLVRGSRGGSPRKAAAKSALAFFGMGGVNAAVMGAAMPMPILFLLTRRAGPRRRALAAWWAVCMTLAIFWWVFPQAISGVYGFNYLPYTEKAPLTTATGSTFEAIRGASFWYNYFNLGQPMIRGAWTLVASIGPLLGTTVVTGFGLFGLARRRTPERLFLVSCVGAGVAAIGAGYAGSFGGPFAGFVQHLLDGPLAVFRNVSKFTPIVALPLALGFAAGLSSLQLPSAWLDRQEARRSTYAALGVVGAIGACYGAAVFFWFKRYPTGGFTHFPVLWIVALLPVGVGATVALSYLRVPPVSGDATRGALPVSEPQIAGHRGRPFHVALAALALAALFFAAAPLWALRLYPSGGFAKYPDYWGEANDWLRSQHDLRTALLVPGAPFAEFTWGRPLDEPFASMTKETPWATRSLVAPGSNGNILMLDALEKALDSGVSPAGLAPFLASQGVNYLVERNDLNLVRSGAPPPAQVNQVLLHTPGLRQVAQFGPPVPAEQAAPGNLDVYDVPVAKMGLRQIAIFRVEPPGGVVETFPTQNPVVVSGDPGSLLNVFATDTFPGRAIVFNGDALGPRDLETSPGASPVVTDGNQRRDVAFGGIRNNESFVLRRGQLSPITNVEPQSFSINPNPDFQTVAAPVGAAQATSSTFGSTGLVDQPAEGPDAAFDGDPRTAWIADARHNSKGEWVQLDFGREVPMTTVRVTPLAPDDARPTVLKVRISTQAGSVVEPLSSTGQLLRTAGGTSSWLRVTIEEVAPPVNPRATATPLPGEAALPPELQQGVPLGAGLRDVAINGLFYFIPGLQTPNVPQVVSGQPPLYVFRSPTADANLGLGSDEDEEPHMSRSFDVPATTDVNVAGTATPRPGPLLDSLLSRGPGALPLGTAPVQITASSTLGGLPRFRPENLLTKPGGTWLAERDLNTPSLELTWRKPTAISSIVLVPSAQGSPPSVVAIESSAGNRTLVVPPGGGTISFPALTTDSIRIRVLQSIRRIGVIPNNGLKIALPVGFDRLEIPALGDMTVPAPDRNTPFTLPCGAGPVMNIDATTVQTTVSGTLSDLLSLTPLRLTGCGPVPLTAGQNSLTANDRSSPFKVTSLVLRDTRAAEPATTAAASDSRKAQILAWGNSRRIAVSAGSETYLRIAENYNRGWRARLDGRKLEPVQLNGWQQAWRVPAGPAGTVVLDYPPDRTYRQGLLLGAGLVALLVVVVLFPSRRRSLPPSLGARTGFLPLLALGSAVVLVLLAGYLALVVIPLLALGWRYRGSLAYVTAGTFIAAGIAAAAHPGARMMSSTGAFGAPAQILAVIAMAALTAALLLSRRDDRDPSEPDPERAPVRRPGEAMPEPLTPLAHGPATPPGDRLG